MDDQEARLLAAVTELPRPLGGTLGLLEFARAKVFELFHRLLVETNERELRDIHHELSLTLPFMGRIRKLHLAEVCRHAPAFTLRMDGAWADIGDRDPEGIHVEHYEIEPTRHGLALRLRSPFGFNVRLLLGRDVANRLAMALVEMLAKGA